MSGSGGLISCVGGCSSKLFKSRRIHRPFVQNANSNLHPSHPSETPEQRAKREQRLPSITVQKVPNVKKSRKRRDRRLSGVPNATAIRIDHDSDDENETSKSFARQFMFWFCGILIVIVGAGALLYAIITVCASMDRVQNFIQTADTKGMLT